MPAPPLRPAVHPLHVEIIRAGYKSYAAFARSIGTNPSNLNGVMTGRLASWPKIRRQCSAALGLPEAELFPDADRVTGPARVEAG